MDKFFYRQQKMAFLETRKFAKFQFFRIVGKRGPKFESGRNKIPKILDIWPKKTSKKFFFWDADVSLNANHHQYLDEKGILSEENYDRNVVEEKG